MKVITINWNEAGPMVSYIKDHINIEKARQAFAADSEIKEIIEGKNGVDSVNDLQVSHTYIGPMKPEYDMGDALHLDDDGKNYVELCGADRPGAEPITAISWKDWFV